MKGDLAGGKLPSGDFGENAAWWMFMILAYNLNAAMKGHPSFPLPLSARLNILELADPSQLDNPFSARLNRQPLACLRRRPRPSSPIRTFSAPIPIFTRRRQLKFVSFEKFAPSWPQLTPPKGGEGIRRWIMVYDSVFQ